MNDLALLAPAVAGALAAIFTLVFARRVRDRARRAAAAAGEEAPRA